MYLKKTLFGISLLFLLQIHTNAQTTAKLYSNINEYVNESPSDTKDVLIERRTQGQIFMSGGNDYKITSKDKALKKNLKKHYWGLIANDSLYVNGIHHKLGPWYAYAEKIGDQLILKAAITMDKEQREKMATTSMVFGGIIGGLSAGEMAKLRFFYTLNPSTGKLVYLDKNTMLNLISDCKELADIYRFEKEPERTETIERFLNEYKRRKNIK